MRRMPTLEDDLDRERRRIEDLRHRAKRRLDECTKEAESLQAKGTRAAGDGDAAGTAEIERRVQKVRGRSRRYEDLVTELESGGDRLAAEVLLARLQGPEVDLLLGEVERNRELVVQRTTALLRARDRHRALRHRWTELADKIRVLRQSRKLPEARSAPIEFRISVTPANYVQQPDGPTYREVSDVIHHLGL
jgi:phage shock protein A